MPRRSAPIYGWPKGSREWREEQSWEAQQHLKRLAANGPAGIEPPPMRVVWKGWSGVYEHLDLPGCAEAFAEGRRMGRFHAIVVCMAITAALLLVALVFARF